MTILINYFPCLTPQFSPSEDCSICLISPLFVYLQIWDSLIRKNVDSLIRWFSSMRFHFDQEGCCPCCNSLSWYLNGCCQNISVRCPHQRCLSTFTNPPIDCLQQWLVVTQIQQLLLCHKVPEKTLTIQADLRWSPLPHVPPFTTDFSFSFSSYYILLPFCLVCLNCHLPYIYHKRRGLVVLHIGIPAVKNICSCVFPHVYVHKPTVVLKQFFWTLQSGMDHHQKKMRSGRSAPLRLAVHARTRALRQYFGSVTVGDSDCKIGGKIQKGFCFGFGPQNYSELWLFNVSPSARERIKMIIPVESLSWGGKNLFFKVVTKLLEDQENMTCVHSIWSQLREEHWNVQFESLYLEKELKTGFCLSGNGPKFSIISKLYLVSIQSDPTWEKRNKMLKSNL